ncbi:MAG: metallophosphoesterase [Clostridia bacterium]|nr:metallophosphoesterase [Clostridia bacterium]
MFPAKQIVAMILSIFDIAIPFVAQVCTNTGETLMYEWSSDLEFSENYFVELQKTPGKDFKVLNLTDIQLYDSEIYEENGIGPDCHNLVEQLIKDEQPDLITLSGDNFCSTLSTLELIDILDSYAIPWAPVFGNHDGGNHNEWQFWAAWHLANAKYSLFDYGPEDMGYGNYIINLTENDEVIHSFYMMDTHGIIGQEQVKNHTYILYDHLWDNQIAWYEWAVLGNQRLAGHPIQSTAIMHIPLFEYKAAWKSVATGKPTHGAPFGVLAQEYSYIAFGLCRKAGGWPKESNGFFDKVKELDSTKDIIVGHDHYNDFSVLYEGVRLTYALHTGFGSYYWKDLYGGTVLTINSEGKTNIRHAYYSFIEETWVAK